MQEPSKSQRLACMIFPALPLQLLLRRVAFECKAADAPPVVVVQQGQGQEVDEIRPQAPILWPNRAALACGVRRGMRLAEARSLCPELHADVVSDAAVEQGVQNIWQMLLQFTPAVEPDVRQPGLFWLDPNGLQHLFVSPSQWAAAVHEELLEKGFYGTLAVGFNRYCTYALACVYTPYFIAPDGPAERRLATQVGLAQLHWPQALLRSLQTLGVRTLGDFLRLPGGEIGTRFGQTAEAIHRSAQADFWAPLQPQIPCEPCVAEQPIEPADADGVRLLFVIKNMLQPLYKSLSERCEVIAALHIRLQITAKMSHFEHLEPALPTLDERILVELVRLRLSALTLAGPVENIVITVETMGVRPSQLTLLAQKPRRDVRAAAQALAKVRAAMGDASVTRACLADSHLPELCFVWESVQHVELPQPQKLTQPAPLVRQLFSAQRLPPCPVREPELWLGAQYGAICNRVGPFRVSHQWWAQPLERDYYYLETKLENILWIYYSKADRGWFLQGAID